MGILKTGAMVEPLFSAFGEDALIARMLDSRATAIITQRRHLSKSRKAAERLPDLRAGPFRSTTTRKAASSGMAK